MRCVDLIKKYKVQVICILLGFVLYAAAMILRPADGNTEVNSIARSGYGEETSEELYVSGLADEEVLLTIPVSPRKFSDDEIEEAFDKCMLKLQEEVLGENASLQEIYYDLVFTDVESEYGFTVLWDVSSDLIAFDGTVKNEDLEEPVDTYLDVTLSDGDREAGYTLPIRIMPKPLSDIDLKVKRFLKEIDRRDRISSQEEDLKLPNVFEGNKIGYRADEETDYSFLWIGGIIIAVLLYLRDRQNLKNEEEKKLHQMQLDYPEIVSKLMVFIGAGMSIRAAWEAIARDYEKSGVQKRYAYEEICRMCSRLRTGESEGKVYRDFGRTCRSKQYMKLASLLDQNRKSGVANLKAILALEMVEAWEERKNLARRMGEKAGTKLLLPLLMMLGVVMAIIMVPAFLSM